MQNEKNFVDVFSEHKQLYRRVGVPFEGRLVIKMKHRSPGFVATRCCCSVSWGRDPATWLVHHVVRQEKLVRLAAGMRKVQ